MTPSQNGSFKSHTGLKGGASRPSQVNSSHTTDVGALFNLHCARREAGWWHSGSIWSCWSPLCFHRLNNWRAHGWLPLLLPLPHVHGLDLPKHARIAGSDLKMNIWHGGFKSNPMTTPPSLSPGWAENLWVKLNRLSGCTLLPKVGSCGAKLSNTLVAGCLRSQSMRGLVSHR